jgi:hypothetical protein
MTPHDADRRRVTAEHLAADGRPGTADDPLVKATDGYRVRLTDTTDPNSGYYGQQQEG